MIRTNMSGADIVTENSWNSNKRKLKLMKKTGKSVSETVETTAQYSASVEELETKRCFIEDHEIGELPR